jgi:periplasmic mercuric ion binding protein
MRGKFGMVLAGFGSLMVLAAAALAETKVEVKGVHLCCGACVKGVSTALKGMEGVTPACDRDGGTVTLTARDEAIARKALDALADAGYHGETDSKGLAIKPTSGLPTGKVKSLSLMGTHNCCKSCCNAIKTAVKTVPGVTGDTAQPKMGSFEVTGDFDAAALVKALNDAGFHFQVKQ